MGYSQQAGGTWSGDLLVADWEELEKADHVSDVTMKRFKAKEVHPVKLVDFVFPVSAGRLKQPSERTSRPAKSRRMALGPKGPTKPPATRESSREPAAEAERSDIGEEEEQVPVVDKD